MSSITTYESDQESEHGKLLVSNKKSSSHGTQTTQLMLGGNEIVRHSVLLEQKAPELQPQCKTRWVFDTSKQGVVVLETHVKYTSPEIERTTQKEFEFVHGHSLSTFLSGLPFVAKMTDASIENMCNEAGSILVNDNFQTAFSAIAPTLNMSVQLLKCAVHFQEPVSCLGPSFAIGTKSKFEIHTCRLRTVFEGNLLEAYQKPAVEDEAKI
jgi:hypothetical protein